MSNVPRSDWIPIDTQEQLEFLDRSVCWEDSEAVAFVAETADGLGLFPNDVSRSGYVNWNIRILFYVGLPHHSHLEIGCADCDEFSGGLFRSFTLDGRIDSLKRIEIDGPSGERLFRCSRIVYRFLSLDQYAARTYYGFGPGDSEDLI
jgi:hypothetical protein